MVEQGYKVGPVCRVLRVVEWCRGHSVVQRSKGGAEV